MENWHDHMTNYYLDKYKYHEPNGSYRPPHTKKQFEDYRSDYSYKSNKESAKTTVEELNEVYWKKLAPRFWTAEPSYVKFVLACPECDEVIHTASKLNVIDNVDVVILQGMTKMDKHNEAKHKATPEA